MTDLERQYFTELTNRRSWLADALDDPAATGVHDSVVEKYTDQAHFIYELLQNADDVGATSADFRLSPDKLVFVHNGIHHFSITDPAHEREDKAAGKLGDMNAITSVGNSNKQKASIGKFGVGFKSVFQYTNTPYVYEVNFKFKMERFIVPIELETDFPGRKANETVFVFPFNHSERSDEEAYEDIADKLRSLVYPILFLKTLRDISFEIGDTIGLYGKSITASRQFDDIIAQSIHLDKNEGNDIVGEDLWLFTRKDNNDFSYSVGFFINAENKLIPIRMPAFCFFPTKEVTNLDFIIHAPFLLNDSREGIKAGVVHNKGLVKLLAKLAADALSCLQKIGEEKGLRIIDDAILNIVPINESAFASLTDKSRVSFLPFFTELQTALADGLLPTKTGYTSKDHAYWSDTLEINNLLSDEQLSLLLDDEGAAWVFRSYGRNTTGHNSREGLQEYIDFLTTDWINDSDIYSHVSRDFIADQPEEWLHTFYEWIGNVSKRFSNLNSKPIFLDDNGNPAAAYDRKGERTLFLPSIAVMNCPTVKRSLLDNEKTADFIKNIAKLVEPSLKDYIYNTIIPQYASNEAIDTDPHFMIFFNYYCECKHEDAAAFISKIKPLEFLTYYNMGDEQAYRGCASNLYYPSDYLRAYFETKPEAKFIALSEYEKLLGEDESKIVALHAFLSELGIKKNVSTVETEISWSEAYELPYKWHHSTGGQSWRETHPEGCQEILTCILNNGRVDKSILLWDTLLALAARMYSLSLAFSGTHDYYFYSWKPETYTTTITKQIKTAKWLVNKNGLFVSPKELSLDILDARYNTSSDAAKKVLDFLGIDDPQQEDDESDEDDNLTDEQKEDIALAQKIREAGLNGDDDVEEILKEIRRRKERKNQPAKTEPPVDPDKGPEESQESDTVSSIFDDIKNRTKQKGKNSGRNIQNSDGQELQSGEQPESNNADTDIDDYHPNVVDYAKQIERKKEQSTAEIENIVQMQDLQETALSADQYSYLWFKTLLDMEILNSDEDSTNSREVNISFGKIEQEAGTQKTYILKQPNKYIPQYMEDLADIPLMLHMRDDTTKTVAIEVSSVKSYTLRVKLRNNDHLTGVDLTMVREASIKAAKPVFLLEKLREGLASLEFEDAYNMKENLPSNLEFIFGPPGTGKTTYLANNVLIPLMRRKEDLKVLVLTPTNKAADVITARIMESMGNDNSYEDWLVRFGITGSEEIEASPVYHDKTFDLRQFKRSITITTIARFPYDFFMPQGERLYLQAQNWDYIVIDEASMIKLVDIIYPIYKKTPEKFIIAGDPFQIEPITTVELWADENIYTLVNLKSFVNPVTEPMQFDVKTLTTQYRSVPEIGSVFSQFTYGGILQHYRDSTAQRNLNLENVFDVEALNIVKFPVSKYESIYKAKRLKGTTPYQIYSAIFSMEFVTFLANNLKENNPGELFRIGVVAPYKAQASLVDKLLGSADIPSCVEVQVDTIHGFQGDECDIVVALLNPPPSISSSDKLFLNRQNILNVAISRARDYLFLVMPDDNTDKIFNLKKVKHIETLMRKSGAFVEYESSMLEEIMFGSETYIEDNAFATSHQIVNVYGQPEMKYEIRSEDTAVDVQIHKGTEQTSLKEAALCT